MSEPAARTSDRTVVAIAWAVAAVVIALVVAFIAWLALGDRAGSPDADGAAVTVTAPATGDEQGTPAAEDGTSAGGQSTTGQGSGEESSAGDSPAPGSDPGATEQTPSPEVAQLLLDLQRRDPDDTMAVGEVDAPVVMIEYADYRCPYCARFQLEVRPELVPLVEDGTLRIEFRDLVLFDEASELAAVAGRAAAEQGHLTDFQDAVFALSTDGHGDYGREELIAIAEEVGVPDLAQFESDLESEELIAAVRADTEEARSLGVSSTPTFLVNTQVLQGLYPADHVLGIVESEAAAAQQ
ncbi:Protein-disulfide isomerase [Serinicoccus hydrothermalis]|uniref:Protein-disulfide isomerase n=1 Tax=Serinicoccus hydrothermalis TaxID=1758689 RepID=A0A1B1NE49_9MICO|nr:thioredoxin domain-containing protein [Serinicoccus hydrothermalis]ANS79696.1 Protein-disulfide isomerase [Serinicoccus hydrothermalis]